MLKINSDTSPDYSKSEINLGVREEIDMNSYVSAYYNFKLKNKYLEVIKNYIKSCSFIHEEIDSHGITGYRSCELNFVDESSEIHKMISGLFKELNNMYFHYDLFGTCEVQIIKYNIGGNYNWHADYGLSYNKKGVRKLSISIQLSDYIDYTGGELVICDHSKNYVLLDKNIGSGVIFDSKTPHKANAVKSGTRYVLVAWAHGPQLR